MPTLAAPIFVLERALECFRAGRSINIPDHELPTGDTADFEAAIAILRRPQPTPDFAYELELMAAIHSAATGYGVTGVQVVDYLRRTESLYDRQADAELPNLFPEGIGARDAKVARKAERVIANLYTIAEQIRAAHA